MSTPEPPITIPGTSSLFPETADPADYVPREATDRALAALESWRGRDDIGSTVAALVAAPGLGKTLLLRLLEARWSGPVAGGAGILYLPYAGIALPDLCAWCHGLLGRGPGPAEARDHPLAALAALLGLGHGPGEPFTLLIDDADSMPIETVRGLAQGLPRERSPLRLVLALGEDARSSRLLAALDLLRPTRVPLRPPMSLEETRAFLAARLERSPTPGGAGGLPALEASLLERIHRLSGGVPRRVHAVAAELLARPSDEHARALERKRRRDAWLGSPIDDEL